MFSRLSFAAALLFAAGSSRAEDPKEIRRETDPSGAVRVRFICGNRATDERLALLPQYPDIEEVEAFGNAGFSDAGVAHIAALPNLKSVSLGCLHLTPKGLSHLRGKTSLKELLIKQLPLTNELANEIAAIPNLEILNISPDAVEPGAWEQIAKLPKLRVLSVSNTLASATSADLVGLEHFTQLERITLISRGYDHEALAKIAGNKGLKELRLSYVNLTDEAATQIANFRDLETLSIYYGSIAPTALAALTPLTKLRYFAGHSLELKDADFLALKDLPQLREIDTSGEHLTEATTHQLRAVMHNTVVNKFRWKYSVADLRGISHKVELNEAGEVVAVRMICHSRATDAKLTLLQKFPAIERLELAGSFELTDEGLQQLHKLPKLRHVFIMSEMVTDAGLNQLAQNSELETVELSTPKVTAAGVAELKRLLPKVTVTVEE